MITEENRYQLRTLVEAIREGSKLRPQCYWRFYSNGGSCVLGAAAEHMGKQEEIESKDISICNLWPVMNISHFHHQPCPCCFHAHGSLSITVVELNDNHRWTREQIADWLETLSRKE